MSYSVPKTITSKSIVQQQQQQQSIDPFIDPLVPSCPQCRTDIDVILDQKGGKFVCCVCGMVCGDRLVTDESEWRSFSDEKGGPERSRVGGPVNDLDDGGLFTAIGGSESGRPSWGKWQTVAANQGRSKAIRDGFADISEFSVRMDIGSMVETRAKEIFKQLHDTKQFHGRQRMVIVTACIYLSCREASIDRSRNELCRFTDVDRRDLGRVLAKAQQILRSSSQSKSSSSSSSLAAAAHTPTATLVKTKKKTHYRPPSTVVFMNRYCSQLVLSQDFINAVTEVARRVDRMGLLSGRQPGTIAGACIYMTSLLDKDTRRPLEEIADIATIAASTIRNAFRLIYPQRVELIPSTYKSIQAITQMPTT